MNGKPDNLSEMIRRALQVQAELGIGEIVVKHRPLAFDNAVADTARIVPIAQAVMSEDSATSTFQTGLDMDSGPRYESLAAHCEAINGCMKCALGETRNKFVYGVGNPNAGIMFVGEAPGAKEDELGEPFVGRAGQLFDKILAAMKLSRSDVYIANILKCRPPENRDPLPEEMEKCFPHLREQVRIIKPKLICCLGRIAAQALLKTTASLGTLRGGWHSYEGVTVLVTYHSAALLRFPKYKKDTWDDMQKLLARYESMK